MTGVFVAVDTFEFGATGWIQHLGVRRPCPGTVGPGQQVVVTVQAALVWNLLQNPFAQLFDFVLAAQVVLIDVLAARIALGQEMSKILLLGRQVAIDALDSKTVLVRAVW